MFVQGFADRFNDRPGGKKAVPNCLCWQAGKKIVQLGLQFFKENFFKQCFFIRQK